MITILIALSLHHVIPLKVPWIGSTFGSIHDPPLRVFTIQVILYIEAIVIRCAFT